LNCNRQNLRVSAEFSVNTFIHKSMKSEKQRVVFRGILIAPDYASGVQDVNAVLPPLWAAER